MLATRLVTLLIATTTALQSQRPVSGSEPARLIGTVIDSAAQPLSGVRVSVDGGSGTALTDSAGKFSITDIPPGAHVVRYRAVGFLPENVALQFEAGRQLDWAQSLEPLSVHLALVVVNEARPELDLGLQGFEARRKLGRGQFMTRDEFEKFAPRDVEAVLERFHALQVKETADGPLVTSSRGMTLRNMQPAVCAMQIGVDGQLMPSDFTIDDISIANVAAIEVYAGPATVPEEFNSSASGQDGGRFRTDPGAKSFYSETATFCGLVMFWTGLGGR